MMPDAREGSLPPRAVHTGWVIHRSTHPPDLFSPQEIAAFRSRLHHLRPVYRRVLRARASGLSIPEVAAMEGMSEKAVRNATTRAISALGVYVDGRCGAIFTACYLLGYVEHTWGVG